MKDSGESEYGAGRDPASVHLPLSGQERAALAAWQPVEPPAGFADRVLAAWQTEAPVAAERARAQQPLRTAAVAAVALLLLGGFFSVRSFVTSGSAGAGSSDPAVGFTAQDGGPGPEVRPQPEGGIERQPS